MLYTRNARFFREYYQLEKAQNRDPDVDVNFVDLKHPNPLNFIKGFGSLIFGSGRDNVESFLRSTVLNVAADQQSVYEMIQNADDCDASFINISYNDKYLLCINNGKPFSDRNMAGLINVGDSDKTLEEIGSYGIGFKIVHRLLGEDDGADAIVKNYAGAVIFSWNKFSQFDKFLKNDEIKIGYNKEMDKENPWLIKLIFTCFPTHLNESVRTSNYQTKKILFENSELDEFRSFLSESLSNINLSQENFLNTGTMIFLKLAEGKSKSVIEKNIEILKSGIAYSFNFLQSLNKIYIKGESIFAQKVKTHSIIYPKDSEQFININPRNKERPIEAKFGFSYSFTNRISSSIPNFYTFFSMDDEKNNFGFLIHCNAFDKHSDRRKLQPDSQSNPRLFSYLIPDILAFVDAKKGEKFWDNNLKKNIIPFNELYATFLLAEEPKNKPQILEGIYLPIKKYLVENIPTLNRTFSNNPQNVKIKKLKLNLDLANFGLSHIEWFEWDNEADKLLIEEAKKSEKLGIKEWDVRDVVENANFESINNWITTCDKETYNDFLKELEESNLRKETKERICEIKLFKFSNNKFFSFNEIISLKDKLGKTAFKFSNCFFSNNKTKEINNELIKLECVVSELSVEDYPKLFASAILPEDKKLYELIAEKCKTNSLSPQEKKILFLNFINDATKFDNVAEGTIKDLHLFCDSNSQIKPLNKLIDCKLNLASWLNAYKIKSEEFFSELNPFLISEPEAIFKEIYLPNQNIILSELKEAQEIKSLINLYQVNQKQFFKEFIIKKTEHSFSIVKKTSNTYQVQSADPDARKFIDENCTINLFVLPQEFLNYKDEDGIIKADDLHSLILDFVDVDEQKEILIDIVKYKARYKFLQKLSEFTFNSGATYKKEDFEHKILDLVCSSELKESDYQNFKIKVIIETESQNLKLSEIPPFTDKIKINDEELSLAKILPENYENSDHLSNLINQFVGLGFNKVRIGKLFGVSEEPEIREIFQMFSEQVKTLENAEQLAFLFLYGLYIERIDFKDFKALNLEEEDIYLGTDKYLTDFNFIKQSEILHEKYRDITKVFKEFPIKVENNDNLLLIKEPYFEGDKFICPYLNDDLSDEQKLGLVNFLLNQWAKNNKKTAIKNIDWSKIGRFETERILGFNPTTSVYPNKYACESEVLPDYLIKWIGIEANKLTFLVDLGVWIENSVVVELRKFLKGETKEFYNNYLTQEKRFNDSEINLFNVLEWLKESKIELKTAEQFETFKKVVSVINDNRSNNNLIVEEEFNFVLLEHNSFEWKKTEKYTIYLYEGEMPILVKLDEIEDYIFYRYNAYDYAVGTKSIYLNGNKDQKKILQKIASADDNNFSFEELWKLYEVDSFQFDDLDKEDAEFLQSYRDGYVRVRAHWRSLPNRGGLSFNDYFTKTLENELVKYNEVILGAEYTSDISKNDQIEANREAKEIVREKLENEGFEFTKGISEYSTINGVFNGDVEFPLVVKSYKYQDEPLKIGANEWIQLMRPNSMFWVHFGNRNIGCLKLYELLKNQDNLTISFSTENLDKEDRLGKFAELLHYFGNVHFDFKSVKHKDYSIANDLADYRFDERKPEEDLSSDDESLL